MFHSTFRQLEVFVAVVDEGSFASGAERLAISQPAISNHIRALESQVGCKLLDRRRGTTCDLTIAGRQLYEEAIDVAGAGRSPRAAPAAHPRARAETRAHHHGIVLCDQTVDAAAGTRVCRQRSTASCRWCGPDHSRKPSPACAAEALISDTWCARARSSIWNRRSSAPSPASLYVAHGHPLADRARVSAEDVRRHPFIMPVNGSHLAALVRRNLGSIGITGFPVALQAEYSDVMEMTASQGVGIVCMFDGAALPHVQSGRLRRLPVDIPPLEIRRAYGTRRGARTAAQRLAQFIEAAMAQAPQASARLTSAA